MTWFALKQLSVVFVQHTFNRSLDAVIAGGCRQYFTYVCLHFFIKFLKQNK